MTRKEKTRYIVALVSFFLVLCIATMVTIFTKANFLKGSGVSDDAKVAKFVFIVTPSNSKDLVIDCRKDESKQIWTTDYPFEVSNTRNGQTCEVAVEYDIIITLPKALISGVSMAISSSDATMAPIQSTSTVFKYHCTKNFEASVSDVHQYNIKFTTDASVIVDALELNNIKIEINASQID